MVPLQIAEVVYRTSACARRSSACPGAEELIGEFAPGEVAQLALLRSYFQTHPDSLDANVGLRRLEFARWLVQNGRLNEGAEPHSTVTQQPAA